MEDVDCHYVMMKLPLVYIPTMRLDLNIIILILICHYCLDVTWFSCRLFHCEPSMHVRTKSIDTCFIVELLQIPVIIIISFRLTIVLLTVYIVKEC